MGVNVERYFEYSPFLHTFASEIRNKTTYNHLKRKRYEKDCFRHRGNVRNENAKTNDSSVFFKRISCYLELDKNQMETVKVSMAEFNDAMENLSQQRGRGMGFRSAHKIVNRHKKQMKQILSDKQYKKFEEIFDLTARNKVIFNMDRIVSARKNMNTKS